MEPLSAIVAGGILLLLTLTGLVVFRRKRLRPGRTSPSAVPGNPVTLKPLLNEAQTRFYNLLRLAVEERYLIFVHVPLWCFIHVPIPANESRVSILSQLALKRATFVLVHPGTVHAEAVLDWIEEQENRTSREEPDPWMGTVLSSAGVKLLAIRSDRAYTAAELRSLLDMDEVG